MIKPLLFTYMFHNVYSVGLHMKNYVWRHGLFQKIDLHISIYSNIVNTLLHEYCNELEKVHVVLTINSTTVPSY